MNEARKQVFSCIDYCGDIANGAKVYNPSFSPNNIRTVVISPDGMYVRLHVSPQSGTKVVTKLSGKSHYVQVSPLNLYMSGKAGFNPAKEKSMLEMLTTPLVCANIEEIIILKAVSAPQYAPFLNQYGAWEFDYNVLVDKKTGDLLKDVGVRFPRLRYITEVNMPFLTFINSVKGDSVRVDSAEFLTDMLKQYVVNTYTFNEEWYNGSKLLPSVYSLDRLIPKAFDKRKDAMKGILKEQGVAAKKVVDQITFYCNLVKEIVTLPQTAMRGIDGEVIFEYDGLSNLEPVTIADVGDLPNSLKNNPAIKVIPKPDNVSVAEALQRNSQTVLMAIKSLHDRFATFVAKNIYFALIDAPTTAMGCLYNCEYFFEDLGAPVIIPQTADFLNVCKEIVNMYPDFKLEPVNSVNYRGSISEWLYFFVNFNYTDMNLDVMGIPAIDQRLNKGVTDTTENLFKPI